jgi:hypothetical protein
MPLAAFLLAVAAQDAFALKWQPKKGETHVYELELKDKETGVEASVEHKVTETKPDGSYTVQSRSLGALVRIAGNEIRDDRPNEARATFDAQGRLKDIQRGSAGLEKYRNTVLMRFVAPDSPVKPGGKWSSLRPADQPKGLAAIRADYTFVAVKDGEAEVSFVLAEQGGAFPQTATGTWWIDAKSGQPLRMQAKVKNFAGQEGGETEVKLALRRPG